MNLDEIESFKNIDSRDILSQTYDYDVFCKQGYKQVKALEIKLHQKKVDEIVFCSVGGGPVASLLQIKSMLFDEIEVPIILNQAYSMPAYVDENSIVFMVNYSGGSEEMVSAYQSAQNTGATIIVLTAGGFLKEKALEHRHLLFELPNGKVPRLISTSHVLIPVLVILHRLGLIADPDEGIQETIKLFSEIKVQYAEHNSMKSNLAKQMAIEMNGLTPIIYGTLPFTDSAAVRFKYQLAENSKTMAFSNAMSGLHHDESFGWDDTDMMKKFHFTLIHDSDDSEKMTKRIKTTCEVLRERTGAIREVTSTGHTRMARLCSLLYLFDYTSLYLAIQKETDPSWSEAINQFRQKYNQ